MTQIRSVWYILQARIDVKDYCHSETMFSATRVMTFESLEWLDAHLVDITMVLEHSLDENPASQSLEPSLLRSH